MHKVAKALLFQSVLEVLIESTHGEITVDQTELRAAFGELGLDWAILEHHTMVKAIHVICQAYSQHRFEDTDLVEYELLRAQEAHLQA